jgi:Ni,Fe-hydrogenase I small subunit
MQLELINKKKRLSDVILQSQSLSSITNEWIAAQHIMEAATYWEMIWLGSNNCAGCLLDELHIMQWGYCEVSISVRKGVC